MKVSSPRLALKTAIFGSGQTQEAVAAAAGITSIRLSRIVRGHVVATPAQARAIALALAEPVTVLFQGVE
jgi:transcriptional regulator with XRE-family HTH domain